MRCPFLREAQVKSCQASAYRKMIVRTPGPVESERCSSPDYITCPAAKQHYEELPDQSRCPFLQESLVQYCSAAQVTKYVPYSESPHSRCSSGSFHYCDLYVSMSHPERGETNTARESGESIDMPADLCYATNHLWLDTAEDGSCHIGIDGLLARVLGSVEKITFLTLNGFHRPTVVVSVRGVDLQLVFPNPIQVTGSNMYMRTNPGKLITDPYTLGWLFEGNVQKHPQAPARHASAGLLRGKEARAWMQRDQQRISEFIHEHLAQPTPAGERYMMDGGVFSSDIIQHLSREEILHLFNEFFSPYASLRR